MLYIWLFLSRTDLGSAVGDPLKILSDRDIYEIQSSFIPGKAFREHPDNYPRLSVSVIAVHPPSRSIITYKDGPEEILIPDTESPVMEMKVLSDICYNDIKRLHKLPDKFYRKTVIPGLVRESHLRSLLGIMMVAQEKFEPEQGKWVPAQILENGQVRFPWKEALYHLDRFQGNI